MPCVVVAGLGIFAVISKLHARDFPRFLNHIKAKAKVHNHEQSASDNADFTYNNEK